MAAIAEPVRYTTVADAIRRSQKDPVFAKDFAMHPEKYQHEYNLTASVIQKIKAAGSHFAPVRSDQSLTINYY